jgi:serine/threonine protein kinase/Flp pilus assembly protein TadD
MNPDRLGRYRLGARIATGGMAELFLAQQEGPEGFSKTVVIKRLLPHLARNRGVVEMFLNEARIASLLDHPNVAQVFDLGQEGEDFFIAMEALDGRTLAEVQEASQAHGELLSLGLALHILAEACAGLHHAHRALGRDGLPLGVVHRDFNPSNVFITYDGRVKVLDFGIAKVLAASSHTEPGTLKGKYYYMSPEMVRGQPVDHRADLFAVGVMLYDLLTGRLPFQGTEVKEVLEAITRAQFEAPRSIDPSIPEELEALCLRLLETDPRNRPRTADEVRFEIETFLEGTGPTIGRAEVSLGLDELFPIETDKKRQEITRLMRLSASVPIEPSPPRALEGAEQRPAPMARSTDVIPVPASAPRSLRRPALLGGLALLVVGGVGAVAIFGRGLPAMLRGRVPVQGRVAAAPLAPVHDAGPGASEAHQHLLQGRSYASQRYGSKAEVEYREALRLAPRDPEAYLALADLKAAQGELGEALHTLEEGHRQIPGDRKVAAALASFYGHSNDWKRAAALLEKLVKEDIGSAELHAELGFARYQLGDNARAGSEIQTALRLKPDLARAYYYLGFVDYKAGQLDKAIEDYRTAAEKDKKSTDALMALAELYRTENRLAESQAAYKEVLARDPQDATAKAALSQK